MASWVLVPALVSLRAEFNALAPSREKSSAGSIGDSAHASSSSDHNPDETGATPYEDVDSINEVHAIDVDIDLRKPGWKMAKAVDIIVTRHRTGRDDRLQNVIYKRRIWSRSGGWTAREYTGSNPHDEHAHFSSRYTTAQEASTRPWGLLEQEDDVSQADVIAALNSADGQAAIGRATLNASETISLVVQSDEFSKAVFDAVTKAMRERGEMVIPRLAERGWGGDKGMSDRQIMEYILEAAVAGAPVDVDGDGLATDSSSLQARLDRIETAVKDLRGAIVAGR